MMLPLFMNMSLVEILFEHRYGGPCIYFVKLARVFQVHGDSEVSFGSWQQHKDNPFTPEGCVVFEVVVYRQANIDVVIRPLGGRTGAAPF